MSNEACDISRHTHKPRCVDIIVSVQFSSWIQKNSSRIRGQKIRTSIFGLVNHPHGGGILRFSRMVISNQLEVMKMLIRKYIHNGKVSAVLLLCRKWHEYIHHCINYYAHYGMRQVKLQISNKSPKKGKLPKVKKYCYRIFPAAVSKKDHLVTFFKRGNGHYSGELHTYGTNLKWIWILNSLYVKIRVNKNSHRFVIIKL